MREPSQRAGSAIRQADVAFYALTAAAVFLGWQITIQPLIQRAPAELAIRLAPGSPLVLRRAAESELAAGRIDNAATLSTEALTRAPFDVRALRVLGLTEAREGREVEADELLTLAGNWSLRDDPSHAWLVERRLKRGDYVSSFAHADTLVRRREDIQPQIFHLYTTAGIQDPQRSLPVLADLLAARPPWRSAYLSGLGKSPQELQLAANLAILLQRSRAPLTNDELRQLYQTLLGQLQFPALKLVRDRLNRPAATTVVTNGSFSDPDAPDPFQWRLNQKAGIAPVISEDDLEPNNSGLRVEYDGYATGAVVEQLTFLSPGAYALSARSRLESGSSQVNLSWTLSCATGGEAFASTPAGGERGVTSEWTATSGRVVVPQGCPAQWLRLETRARDRRNPIIVWFDDVKLSPAG